MVLFAGGYFLFLFSAVLLIFYCSVLLRTTFYLPFVSFLGFKLNTVLCFDRFTVICILMLFICGLTVIPFVSHYMGSYIAGWSLFFLIISFIFVMGVLMTRGDYLGTLFAWEYLGLVRYLLILFLCNLTSIRASLITVFASRFGDVALFFLVAFGALSPDCPVFIGILLILVVFTKGAMFPFISWLLEAMRAPTPVSCLVHSSTLVAAGVWFSLRYGHYFSDGVLEFLGYISLYTIFVTGFSALFLVDLKKLVALSTCNNISWCMLCFSLGDLETCLMFLLVHGIRKCLLFIVVGDVMSSSLGRQKGLGVYFSRQRGLFTPLVGIILLSSLCGLPFLGVFLSKHLLIDAGILGFSSFFYYLCCFCVVLSFCYTYRFGFILLTRLGGLRTGVIREYFVYLFIGFLPSLVSFIGFGVLRDYLFFSGFFRILSMFFLIHLVGVLLSIFCYGHFSSLRSRGMWMGSLAGCDYLVLFFYSYLCRICDIFYASCYRWEVSLVDYLRFMSSMFSFRLFFSRIISFSVMGVFGVLFVFYFMF